MASRWRRTVSLVLGAMLASASLAAMPTSPAQALEPSTDSSCLIINSQHELVSADFCTGDIVVPASVTTIKRLAFFNFKGAVSFEANSQLTRVERGAFYAGGEIKSIIFPPSLNYMDAYGVADTGDNVLYFEGNPLHLDSWAVWQGGTYTLIQPRGSASLGLAVGQYNNAVPFQIDCNAMNGDKDFIGRNNVALELHNCVDPRNPSGANPPARMGYILNKNLNESVSLRSVDGLHQATVRLRQLGDSGMRLAATQEINGAGFSISAFGDEYELPVNSSLTCGLSSSTPLPVGVSLTTDCKLEAASTTALPSSATDITINWVSHPGASNSYDVSQNPSTLPEEPINSGSIGVRVSLRKASQLTATQLFQMKLATAQYSGTTRDWNLAVSAYRALASDQVPAGSPDSGNLAVDAVKGFEAGSATQSAATSAVDTLAGQTAPQSTFVSWLRSRIELRAVANLVAAFEAAGAAAKYVRQRILALPNSNEKTALWARFESRANTLFGQTSVIAAGIRTIVFSNPYQVERFTVPAGVTQINVEVLGAEGSQGGEDPGAPRPNRSGYKGRIQGTVGVAGGQVLTLGVGEAAGDAPGGYGSGTDRVVLDSRVARGGVNPLGGYAGGNGGSPGVDGNSGYGGAGGAASVVQIGDGGHPISVANIVAGGSAGSSGSSDQNQGQTGLASANSRSDAASTNGRSARALWWYTFPDYIDWPSDGGAIAGGGGGAIGGETGTYDLNQICGNQDYCPSASSPGQNSTSGLSTLTASYSAYTFDDGQNANGRITISYVVPPVTSNPGGSGGSGGGTASPTPTPTGSPTPAATTSDAPAEIKAVPFWKGAEVSWKAPAKDGGSPITGYEAIASTGQSCQTATLSCLITGFTPGQLIEVSVVARNAAGASKPATPSGPKVFAPLSLNLWQTKLVAKKPTVKLMNSAQLSRLRSMLEKDVGGFVLQVKVAKNASSLSSAALKSLLAKEVREVSGQLSRANLRSKVLIKASVVTGNQKAHRPSVILTSTKP